MEKHCVAKVLLAISEMFLHENNRSYNFYRFRYKFVFILFLSFLTNQKQKSSFQHVTGPVTTNVINFLFIASQALLQSHTEFNRILESNFLACYSCFYHSFML